MREYKLNMSKKKGDWENMQSKSKLLKLHDAIYDLSTAVSVVVIDRELTITHNEGWAEVEKSRMSVTAMEKQLRFGKESLIERYAELIPIKTYLKFIRK